MIQLLGASYHQAVLSYLQCQALCAILVMMYSQPIALALGSYVHKVLASMGWLQPQHQNNGKKNQRTIILSLQELKPRMAAAKSRNCITALRDRTQTRGPGPGVLLPQP